MKNLITIFTEHKVAANLLMLTMMLVGVFSLFKINYQFFPSYDANIISVNVVWPGSTAEDIESSITNVLEKDLKKLDQLKKITSNSSNNASVITLEFNEGANINDALERVKNEVSKASNLPADSESPIVSRFSTYDDVSKILLSIDGDLEELRNTANRFEDELSDIAGKVEVNGLVEREMVVEIKQETLLDLNMSLQDISDRIRPMSKELPAGTTGEHESTRRLRFVEQKRSPDEYANLIIKSNKNGQYIRLGEIAQIKLQEKDQQPKIFFQGRPAVQFLIKEPVGNDIIDIGTKIKEWFVKTKPTLPPTVGLNLHDERWKLVEGRLNLLLENGASGLLLVIVILVLFLNIRVAFWVAFGILTSLLAAIAVLYSLGGSINMLSMFALIMTLGIIVDDAIVVAEEALSQFQKGHKAIISAEKGALGMLAPVVSSSLSTIATFLPLMIISGIIGKIISDIPLVVICVILVSLVESFLVLPGHLSHTMAKIKPIKIGSLRHKLDQMFFNFRDGSFTRIIVWSIGHKRIVIVSTVASFVLGMAMIIGGRIPFNFFPTPEGDKVSANVSFVAGTPESKVLEYVQYLRETLKKTEEDLGGELVKLAVINTGKLSGEIASIGTQHASIRVELTPSSERDVSTEEFIVKWKSYNKPMAGLEAVNISASGSAGPAGADLEIHLKGEDTYQLKVASEELIDYLTNSVGVISSTSDMLFGQEQYIFKLNAEALALGLTVQQIGDQLRHAYDGLKVQTYIEDGHEIEVRVQLPSEQTKKTSSLDSQMIKLPSGKMVLLQNLIEITSKRGFDVLRHSNAKLSVKIESDLDSEKIATSVLTAKIEREILPTLTSKYGVSYSFEGSSADQEETINGMLVGLILAVILMYIVLSWVFASYGWPLIVMSAIPVGIVGAIFGHWLMDFNITILSLFGFFGLSGIVVNDSIVLVTLFKKLREGGMGIREAVVNASTQRLRAVILTSLTTIVGLLPLLFETSRQAQFLIPMAISITFGLAFATVIVLIYIPVMLTIYEQTRSKIINH